LVKLDFHSGVPVYRQIMDQLRAAILSGALKPGDQLPTIRELHQRLGVNPNTVARAYRELALADDIAAEQGSGCYVKPPAARPPLDAAVRQEQLSQFCTRFASEAQLKGFSLDELVLHLTRLKSP
jgi:GntR family transcriptional regulator